MAEIIDLQRNLQPWEGNPDAFLLETYDFYDMPLLGILQSGSDKFLFHCVTGQVETINFWMYTRVTDDQIASLEATPDEVAFNEMVEELSTRRSTLAVAAEGFGIIAFGEVSPENLDLSEKTVQGLIAAVNDGPDGMGRLQEQARAQGELVLA